MRPHLTMTAVLLSATALFSAAPSSVQSDRPDKDAQIAELTQRVEALEARLSSLEDLAMPLFEEARTKQICERAQAAAHQRMREDRGKYSPEVLSEVEQLYQTANKDWRSPAAVAAMEKLINEYPDLNRTGCATLYLGQMSQDTKKIDYLMRAKDDFSDCYYGDGVNVGAYATYLLACHHQQEGNYDQANKLFNDIKMNHAYAIDHRGRLLVDLVQEALTNATPRDTVENP